MNIKKITLLIAGFLFFSIFAFAQQDYQVQKDKAGDKILVGKLNLQLLANDSAFSWFYTGVNDYNPNQEWVKYIKYYRDSFSVVVFAGTWERNSQKLIPLFYRTMMAAGYPLSNIQIYGVDEQLHSLHSEAKKYKIEKLPTIIVLDKAGEELG